MTFSTNRSIAFWFALLSDALPVGKLTAKFSVCCFGGGLIGNVVVVVAIVVLVMEVVVVALVKEVVVAPASVK